MKKIDEIMEFNKRQILLIEQKIGEFEKNLISFNDFVNYIHTLVNHIQNPQEKWIKTYNNLWWEIEQILSYALDKNRKNLTQAEKDEVSHIINQMKDLITQYKRENIIEESEP
jgi:hypothetical protein